MIFRDSATLSWRKRAARSAVRVSPRAALATLAERRSRGARHRTFQARSGDHLVGMGNSVPRLPSVELLGSTFRVSRRPARLAPDALSSQSLRRSSASGLRPAPLRSLRYAAARSTGRSGERSREGSPSDPIPLPWRDRRALGLRRPSEVFLTPPEEKIASGPIRSATGRTPGSAARQAERRRSRSNRKKGNAKAKEMKIDRTG